MVPDRNGRHLVPLPLLPSAAWPFLAAARAGDVALLLVVAYAVALVTFLLGARALVERSASAVPLVLVTVGLLGLGLGTELGFAFGGGRRLALWSVTLWLAARAVGIAGLVVATRGARPRAALFGWRRMQVVSLVCSVVLWLIVVGSNEVGPEVSAASLHGVRAEVLGGAPFLALLFVVSVVAEGLLWGGAHRATRMWLETPVPARQRGAAAPSQSSSPSSSPSRPVVAESITSYGPPRPEGDDPST